MNPKTHFQKDMLYILNNNNNRTCLFRRKMESCKRAASNTIKTMKSLRTNYYSDRSVLFNSSILHMFTRM